MRLADRAVAERIAVEIVLATQERQVLLELEVQAGATVADVIARSRIAEAFPGFDIDALETGVWGRIVSRDHQVVDGDRVELYRPLQMDPREARRKQALAGRTMGQAPESGAPTDRD